MLHIYNKSACQKVRESLSEYIYDTLDEKQNEIVRMHIEKCSSCKQQLDSIKSTIEMVRHLPEITTKHSFVINSDMLTPVNLWNNKLITLLRPAIAISAIALITIFILDLLNIFSYELIDTAKNGYITIILHGSWVLPVEIILLTMLILQIIVLVIVMKYRKHLNHFRRKMV